MREAVLVKRNGAMGDVIMTTPVIARLRHHLGPDAIIDVSTFSADVYARNPHVSGINVAPPPGGYHRVINLELAYERRLGMHAIDAYMLEAFSDTVWPYKQAILHRDHVDYLSHLPWGRAVALHAGVSVPAKTFPALFWEQVIDGLLRAGYLPIVVGAGGDRKFPEKPGVIDLTGKLSIHQVADVIDRCRCFVSGDTGVTHVAGSTLTPIVAIYTLARPERLVPWRNGGFGWGIISLMPDLDCVGCFTQSWNLVNCNRGDFACVNKNMVEVERVLAAVHTLVGTTGALPSAAGRHDEQEMPSSPSRLWQIPHEPLLFETTQSAPNPSSDSAAEPMSSTQAPTLNMPDDDSEDLPFVHAEIASFLTFNHGDMSVSDIGSDGTESTVSAG
jgi:ADP-heptose:LPS heptosyltransferase